MKTLLPESVRSKVEASLARFLIRNAVPILFTVLCLVGSYYARLPLKFLLNDIIVRMARNSFLVISLIIPVLAGLGLNFGIVLGAMAGQIAVITVTYWEIGGITGFLLSMLLALPYAILFGWLTGILFNRAKGKEMIAGLILGFFANGLYQLVFLFFVGTIIPFRNEYMLLSTGIGLRNTVNLKGVHYALDNLLKVGVMGLNIPVATFASIVLLCLAIRFLFKTKLGQEFRSVGQNRYVAEVSGINVDRVRIIAVIFSTVLAAWGQLIFLQNIGTLNTYGSHVQVGTFAVAALLIGGATVSRATVGQALLGTFLFHLLFIISPLAGKNMMGSAQVGEYFRVFVAYGVIGVALALHAWQNIAKKS
ncbi:MAG: ABC transporter permease [Bacillota bacterium]